MPCTVLISRKGSMYNVKILPFQTLILLKISAWESQCGSTHKISLKDLTMTWQIYRLSGSTSTTQPPLEKPWWRHASYSPGGCWCRKISLKSIAEFRESRGQQNLGLTWEDWGRLKTIDFEIVLVIWLFLHQLSCSSCCVQVTTSSAHQCSNRQPFFSVEVLLNPWVINNIFQSSKSMVVSHSST